MKKLIEIAKRNIKYYDKRILEVENFIKCEEQLRNEYQLMINFFNFVVLKLLWGKDLFFENLALLNFSTYENWFNN